MKIFSFFTTIILASLSSQSPTPQSTSSDGATISCVSVDGNAPLVSDVQAAANQLKAMGSTQCVAHTNYFSGTCNTFAHVGTAYVHGCGTGQDTCESVGNVIQEAIDACPQFVGGAWRLYVYNPYPNAPDAMVWVTYH